ncbi:MAG: hypothetical protein MK110_09320 [Fuerstiella sp.]|nr:hypothetical protein [Fuerstiella sp.]
MVVPAADRIEHSGKWGKWLQNGTDFVSRFAQNMIKQCKDAAGYQGVFVVTPSGLLLAGSHAAIHDARTVEKHLRQGLEKWENLSKAERLMTMEVFARTVSELGNVEHTSQYPRDGLALSVIARDLSQTSKLPNRNAYNLDYAWFRKEEARAFVPVQPVRGARQEVPRDLVERLARFHIIDLVRGNTESYPKEAVEHAELSTEVIDVKADLISLHFRGRTRTSEAQAEAKSNAKASGTSEPETRGVDARLEGQAVFDLKAEKFVSFNLVAVCSRWGVNPSRRLHGRDFGPAPMGVVLELAGASAAEQVPPQFVKSYGWKTLDFTIPEINDVSPDYFTRNLKIDN